MIPDNDPTSLEAVTAMAEAALADIPPAFTAKLDGVAIRVAEMPEDWMLRSVGVAHPLGLLGLYSGLPLGHKSVAAVVQHVDTIWLFRRPILAYWRRSGFPLADIVRHVLIHEIGHHFGLSDADMRRIEQQTD